jgi:hypothetical protein
MTSKKLTILKRIYLRVADKAKKAKRIFSNSQVNRPDRKEMIQN